MESESIVYGCIRDWPGAEPGQTRGRREHNQRVLAQLAPLDAWSLVGAQMFACTALADEAVQQTQVIHFAASYATVEYEWALWIEQFEALLKRLYWSSAVVHLETELNGTHTFRWESDNGGHSPHQGELRVRCAWEREGGVRA